ncbi:hypothetical protein ACOMHN_051700 [Nucella lapillus]
MEVFSMLKHTIIADNVNPINDYFELGRQTGSAGPEMVWKVFEAVRKEDKKSPGTVAVGPQWQNRRRLIDSSLDVAVFLVLSSALFSGPHPPSCLPLSPATEKPSVHLLLKTTPRSISSRLGL